MKKTTLWLAVALLTAGTAMAGTTGSLSGEVKDSDDLPLPGVTVLASSPAQIGGEQITMTDVQGIFSFPRLAPGVYTVRFELDGFATQERTEVEVRLDRDVELHVQMSAAEFSEQVEVTAETPVVDTEQSSLAQTFTEDFLQETSVGSTNRSYLSLLAQTPGVTSSGGNAIVYGSTLAENAYLVDGMDTTDPVTATFGAQLNFDAIQEVSFATAGYDAEYGRATGGLISVITKSGGNELSGSLDARYRDTGFTESGVHFDPDLNKNTQKDYTGTLGGPVLRDRLWFFAAAEVFDAERTPSGAPLPTVINANTDLAKLTWLARDNWEVVAKWSRDPADFEDFFNNNFDAVEAAGYQKQGGDIYQARLSAIMKDSLIWDVNGQVMRQELNAFPSSRDLDTPSILDLDTGAYSNNYPNAQFSTRDRDELRSSLTYFLDGALGSHEIKVGAEYSDLAFNTANNTTAGLIYRDRSSTGGVYSFWRSSVDPPLDFTGTVTGGYAQDAWRITPQVTLRLGVRWDEAVFDNNVNQRIATLDKFQPRLGLAWDISGNGKTVARLAAGRFMHPNALTLPSAARVDQSLPTEFWVSCTWSEIVLGVPVDQCGAEFGPLTTDPLGRDPNGWWLYTTFGGGQPDQVVPGLDAMFSDQLVVGVEHELFNRTSIELSYINKDTDDIFEDTCSGNYPTPTADGACDFYVIANLAGLTRKYEGVVLQFESRAWSWLDLRASYAYSKSQGNVEYTQNVGTDYDYYPQHYVNRYGYLSDDRRHRVKITGYARLPLDFGVGFNAFWSSKFAYDITQVASPYGVEFLEPRGSFRANDNYQLDLQISKGFNLRDYRFEVIAAVFNALDSERPIQVCERSEGCGATAVHGDPLAWQRPRGYEAGFRFTF